MAFGLGVLLSLSLSRVSVTVSVTASLSPASRVSSSVFSTFRHPEAPAKPSSSSLARASSADAAPGVRGSGATGSAGAVASASAAPFQMSVPRFSALSASACPFAATENALSSRSVSGAAHPCAGYAKAHRHVALAPICASDCVGGISRHRSHLSHATQESRKRVAAATCSLSVSRSNAASSMNAASNGTLNSPAWWNSSKKRR